MIPTPTLHPATLAILKEFEGKPRLTARLCEGGRYEVAYGVTYYLDGSPVQQGDRITEDQVMPLTLNALAVEGAQIWKALEREVTPEMAGALSLLGYNIGGGAVANSIRTGSFAVLNSGRTEDAAAAFGLFTAVFSVGPSPTEVAAGIAPAFPRWEDRGKGPRWLDRDGNECIYVRRFRGLLRRHHAEGCLSMGLDWREATKNDAISMATEAVWNAAKSRWEDKIIRQTEFREVLAVARKYPLASASAPVFPAPKAPVPKAPVPEPKPIVVAQADPPPEPKPAAPPPVERPVPAPKPPVVSNGSLPNDFDPDDGMKAMIYSRRFWGWMLIVLGRLSFITDGGSNALSQVGGTVGDVANGIAADPMLLDMYTGMSVMFVGEAVRWWGEKKATKVLK